MKKTLLLLFILFTVVLSAQKFKYRGAGIYGAGLSSAHYYKNTQADLKVDTVFVDAYYYPQTHISRDFINWGAGIFVEFSVGRKFRWQTELEYANKGAKENEIIDRFMGTRRGDYVANKYTYIQWNNYLKSYTQLVFGKFYYLAGVRLEYLFKRNASVFTPYSNNLKTFWFSGNLALGYEIPITKRLGLFVEGHWNPDFMHEKIDQVKIRNRTFELRLGVIYKPRKPQVDDCNAPTYKGPVY